MATFQFTQPLINEGESTLLDFQTFLYLESDTWDWANTSSDGRDFRAYLPDDTLIDKLWIPPERSWDKVNQYACIPIRIPSLPPGQTDVTLRGGDLTLASLSSYDATMQPGATDDDVYQRVPCSEGTGTNISNTAGTVVGTFNGTWKGSAGGRFGRGQISPAPVFSAGNALVFNGVNQYAKFPNFLNGGTNNGLDIPHEGTITFWLRQRAVNAANKVVFGIQRFGLYSIYMLWQGNNTVLMRFDTGAGGYADLLSGGEILGPLGGAYDSTASADHFIGVTYGGRGVELWHDCQIQSANRNIRNRYKPLSGAGTATGLYIGNLSDDGATGNAGTFANQEVSEFCFHSRQLTRAEMSLIMHRMKVIPGIQTADGRLNRLGVTLAPDQGAAFNLNQWSEPVGRTDLVVANRKVLWSRAASLNADSGVICSTTSTAGLKFDPPTPTRLVGATFGGEALAALCPAYGYRNGTHYLMYSVHDFGTAVGLAASATDAALGPYVKLGNLTFPGYSGGFGNKHFWWDAAGVMHLILEGTPAWTLYHGTIDLATLVCTLDLTPLTVKQSPAGDASGPSLFIASDGRYHLFFHAGAQSAVFHQHGKSLQAMLWGPHDMILDFDPGLLDTWSGGIHQTQTADADPREDTNPITGAKRTRIVYAANTGGGSAVSVIMTAESDGSISELVKPSVRAGFPDVLTTADGSNYIITQHQGGTDKLKPKINKVGQPGVNVSAYLQTDYDAGSRSVDYVRDQQVTNSSGDWPGTMHLAAGTYAFTFNDNRDVYPPVLNISVP